MKSHPRFKAPLLHRSVGQRSDYLVAPARESTIVIYDDGEALARATREFGTFDRVPLWRADLLPHPGLHTQAARDLLTADVLVISLSDSRELSTMVEDWISTFMIARRTRPASLLVLLGPELTWRLLIPPPEPRTPCRQISLATRIRPVEEPSFCAAA